MSSPSLDALRSAIIRKDIKALRQYNTETILDAIWLLSIQPSYRSSIIQVIKALSSEGLVTHDLLLRRLDYDLLEEAEIIEDASVWQRKTIRINTSMFYKQRKFNLLKEEPVGYAQVIATIRRSSDCYKELLCLIGKYDLDPYRVVDLLLEAFALNFDANLLNVVRQFDLLPASVAALFALKDRKPGTWRTIVECIKGGIFELEHILPYLSTELRQVQRKPLKESGAADMLVARVAKSETEQTEGDLIELRIALEEADCLKEADKLDAPWNRRLNTAMCNALRRNIETSPLTYLVSRLGPTGLDHESIYHLSSRLDLNQSDHLSILVRYILPSISFQCPNVFILDLIWKKISALSFEHRSAIYQDWSSNESINESREMSRTDLKRLLRRLSKENVKQYGRLLAKLSHPNPTLVMPLLVEQCLSFESLIGPITESCRYFSNLSFDVLVWSLIKILKKDRPQIKEETISLQDWLLRLSEFIATLAKRYGLDLRPLVDYLQQKLSLVSSAEIVILEELMSKLAGIDPNRELSEVHLDAQAGGPVLRSELFPKNRRYLARLQEILTPELLLVLAKQRTLSLKQPQKNLKLTSMLYDQATSIFLQAIEAFNRAEVIYNFDEHPAWNEIDRECQMLLLRLCGSNLKPFWALQFSEMHVPLGKYQGEIAKLKTVALTGESKKDREKAAERASLLEEELRLQTQHIQEVNRPDCTVTDLISRAMLSPADALYCARIIKEDETPKALRLITNLLGDVLIGTTEREIRHFSRFFSELLISKETDPEIHERVTTSCLECLEADGEFSRCRSALLLLSTLSQQKTFPCTSKQQRLLLDAVKQISDGDPRPDLKLMAVRVQANLQAIPVAKDPTEEGEVEEAANENSTTQSIDSKKRESPAPPNEEPKKAKTESAVSRNPSNERLQSETDGRRRMPPQQRSNYPPYQPHRYPPDWRDAYHMYPPHARSRPNDPNQHQQGNYYQYGNSSRQQQ